MNTDDLHLDGFQSCFLIRVFLIKTKSKLSGNIYLFKIAIERIEKGVKYVSICLLGYEWHTLRLLIFILAV